MKKIVGVIAEYPRDNFWLPISIKSYEKFADKIIIIDGSKKPLIEQNITEKFSEQQNKFIIIESPYPHEDRGADGKQRNKYLDYIKENHEGALAVVVDSDEVLADNAEEQLNKISEQLQKSNCQTFHPRMEHFVDNFSWVDATLDFHYCPGRIFIVDKSLYYPEVEHVMLMSKGNQDNKAVVLQPVIQEVLYYHYGYVKGKEDIIKKYRNHLTKSNVHKPEFLSMWKNAHLSGMYPRKSFQGQHPKPIKEEFLIP